MRLCLRLLVLGVLLFGSGRALGCSRAERETERSAAASSSAEASLSTPLPASASAASPLVVARGVRLVRAPAGADAARVVRDEAERARADARELVVYVGARWCEPCQRFHQAAAKGELDGVFPELTLLEFDADDDRDRLAAAGYVSELIPLFVVPGADGRATKRTMEGSIKGGGAVANITPRLRALLGR